MPAVTLAVPGHSGLGDKDNHYKEAWCSVFPHKIIIRSGLFVTQDTGYEGQNTGLRGTVGKGWPEDKYTKTKGKLAVGVMIAGKIKELDKCR